MYFETMEKVLADIEKVIIDKNSGSRCSSLLAFQSGLEWSSTN